jgi:hypothetical protein
MNDDIVERLRAATPYGLADAHVLSDAAAEIEHLRDMLQTLLSTNYEISQGRS